MDFDFCWEFRGCGQECVAREKQVLFCWKHVSEVDYGLPANCHCCDYRKKWITGEYSVDYFIEQHDRRIHPRKNTKRVLVIDDEPNILFALEETIRFKGYDCISACDGEEGLLMAQGLLPDLVITDVIMPKLDGFELCRSLKTDHRTRNIPVVMVTARNQKQDVLDGQSAGADSFLVKPFEYQELSRQIDRFIPDPT